MKKVLLFIGVAMIAVGIFYVTNLTSTQSIPLETLTFSNTQTWDRALWEEANGPAPFTDKQLATISLPPPPLNVSQETRNEIQTLKSYVELRTPEKIKEIISEFDSATMMFGSSTFGSLLQDRAKTQMLFSRIYKEGNVVLLQQKLLFNRVRPSHLDPSLSLAIELPNHPAYPSGHATQAYLIAHLLSILDPQHEAAYMQSAASIAKNREIAGVHYPSDSKAGRLLARQLFTLFLEDETFVQLLEEAKTEWPTS